MTGARLSRIYWIGAAAILVVAALAEAVSMLVILGDDPGDVVGLVAAPIDPRLEPGERLLLRRLP